MDYTRRLQELQQEKDDITQLSSFFNQKKAEDFQGFDGSATAEEMEAINSLIENASVKAAQILAPVITMFDAQKAKLQENIESLNTQVDKTQELINSTTNDAVKILYNEKLSVFTTQIYLHNWMDM